MPYVDVLSFKCIDESEYGSDEIYVAVKSDIRSTPRSSPVYGGVDSGETYYPNFEPLFFQYYATIRLWEDDSTSSDDLIGSRSVSYNDHGRYTVTLQGSGGTYNTGAPSR